MNLTLWVGGSFSDTTVSAGWAGSIGDYVGIEQIDVDTFRCYSSANGTTWTKRGGTAPCNVGVGSSDCDVAGINSGGNAAMFWYQQAPTFEVFETGNGTLPTSRACGVSP